MVPRKKGKARVSRRVVQPVTLAERMKIERTRKAYALPYFTRNGSDTEYLISNPNSTLVQVSLAIFGKNCKVAKKINFKLKRDCTRSIRIRAIVPEHAGHTVLVTDGDIIAHILYMRGQDIAVVGGELAGSDNLVRWHSKEKSRTYGFGYRSVPLGHDTLGGSVFVSNPHMTVLTGLLVFYDQACKAAVKRRIGIKPGCTAEYPFPKMRFGYGRIQISSQAVINVLHFTASSRGVAAAELVGEANRLSVPVDQPQPGRKILFDDTHACRPGVTGDWTKYEAALNNAGYATSHYTGATVTLTALKKHDVFVIVIPRVHYTTAELEAIADFVNGGGGLLIVQDFGNAPWSAPTRAVLNHFGASDDNNFMEDPTNHLTPGQIDDVVFDYQRNFLPHPITNGWKSFHVDAASSLSGNNQWTTVVETDDDSVPARRPAVIARTFGKGRIVAFGDSNTWANHLIGNLENKLFGVRCAEWLLFQI